MAIVYKCLTPQTTYYTLFFYYLIVIEFNVSFLKSFQVIPAIEYNSVFSNIYRIKNWLFMKFHDFYVQVMTNFVETDQHRGVCDEDYTKVNCTCNQDSDCTLGRE